MQIDAYMDSSRTLRTSLERTPAAPSAGQPRPMELVPRTRVPAAAISESTGAIAVR